jgi:hypothetical protein
MFGRRKRSVADRMDQLTRAARATIAMALMRYYGVGTSVSGEEKDLAKRAAAAANFLNGHPPHPAHADLDLSKVQAEARAWIRANAPMRELVVQTLRVAAMAYASARGKEAVTEDSLSLLSEFPGGSVQAPDPQVYEALVRRAIATLPHDAQIQLMPLAKPGE